MKTYNILLKDQCDKGWITFQFKADNFEIRDGILYLVIFSKKQGEHATPLRAYNRDIWQSIEEVKE
jgi:hypothetical protein